MSHPNNIDADKMLNVYIYDYFIKRKLSASARVFRAEAEVPNRMAIDAPGGFLFEWWSVFWDIFIARHKQPGPGITGSNNATQSTRGHEQQHQQDLRQQMHQMILQKHIEQQQQQKEQTNEMQVQNATASAIPRQNLGLKHESAKRIHEKHSMPPLGKHRLAMADVKIVDRNRVSVSESVAIGDRLPGLRKALRGIPADNLLISNPLKEQSHQLPVPQDLWNMMNPTLNLSAANPDGSLFGVTGSDQGANIVPLKGWPLMGLDSLQAGLLQQQKSLMLTSQQLQMQQQLRMLLNLQKNANIPKDTEPNFGGSIVPNHSLQVQVGLPILSRPDAEVLAKSNQQLVQNGCQYQLHCSHSSLLIPHSEHPSNLFHQQDKLVANGSIRADASFPSPSGGNEQSSTNPITRKRKQPMSSSDHTNGSETANTRSLPADSAPSTPSTHTTDAIAMPTLTHDDSAKAHTNGNGGVCTLTSLQNQQAHVDDLMNTRSLDDKVELLSHDSASAQCLDTNNDFTFSLFGRVHVMAFNCFDFSYKGELIATGGVDKKVVLWCTSFREPKCMIEEHSNAITDIRFGPRLPRLATSSLDKTVKIWDLDNGGNSLRTFIGHSAPIMSVDFHPNKEDLVCSCDDGSAIRYWSIGDGCCAGVIKGGATQVRFQPTYGRHLAAAVGTGVSMIDVETTQPCRYPFKGHASKVQTVCWNASGEYLASMSKDSVRVWKIGSGEKQECIHELCISGKKFSCCIFHPYNPSLMVIGLEQSLELWHMAENKMMTVFGDRTTALAVSQHAGLVASASDDSSIRLWK